MRYRVLVVALVFVSFLQAQSDVLSKLKQEEFKIIDKQNIQNYEKERFDWVEPIFGSLSYTKTDNFSKNETETTTFKISISQPIFKSGGIFFAIKYAKENRLYNLISTKLQKKSLISSAYSLLLNIKKIETNIRMQKFLLSNANIDIKRKTEQYNSGLIDSSFLDDAIIKQSSISTAIANLELQLVDLKKRFLDLSDLEISKVKIPTFSLMSQEEFTATNLDVKQANSHYKKSAYVEDIRWASYMPTIKFNASYNNSNVNSAISSENEYYNYGITISMPIFDMGKDNVLELARLENLKAKVGIAQRLKEAVNKYESTKQKLKIIDKKIELSKENIKRYSSLLHVTKEKFSIGEVTSYDVATMENSLHSKELEVTLLNIDKQIELLELYKSIDD